MEGNVKLMGGKGFTPEYKEEIIKLGIIEYIETFYNCHRLHSTLGNMSPMEYERQYYYRKEVA